MIAFTVFGVAGPAGSHKAFMPKGAKYPIITDSNRNLRSWQQLVADAAGRAIAESPDFAIMGGAVRLSLQFFLPRPKSLKRRAEPHLKKPDCSKLVRATEDALSGLCFRDDAQVVELFATKAYTGVTAAPHVRVRVEATSGIGLAPVVVPPAPLPLFEGNV